MLFASSGSDASQLVLGLCLGAFCMGFLWLICYGASQNWDSKHETFSAGVTYNTRKAHRIMGVMGERVTTDGQWIGWAKSLWRTYPHWQDKKQHFFLLHIDELNPAKLKPVTPEVARKFIQLHSDPELAEKLIRDWIDQQTPVAAVTNEHHH